MKITRGRTRTGGIMVKVTVCIGSSCHLKGSRQVVEQLQALIKQNNLQEKVELAGTFCMGKCDGNGVSVTMNGEYFSVRPDGVEEFFAQVVAKAE